MFVKDLKKFVSERDRIEKAFLYYLVTYISLQFLVAFYMPGNDYDSNANYFVRIKIEEWGDLRSLASIDHQYLFPRLWAYLHIPFLKLEFFELLPSFALFLIFLFFLTWSYWKVTKKFSVPLMALLFCAEPVVNQALSWKDDLAVAVVAFLSFIFVWWNRSKTVFLPVSLLLIASLAGIKWHSLLCVMILLLIVIYRMISERLFNRTSLIATLSLIPAYFFLSDLLSYARNLIIDRSLTPVPYMFQTKIRSLNVFAIDTYKLFSNVLTSPLDLFAGAFNSSLLKELRRITLGVKLLNEAEVIWPSADFARFGWEFLFVIVGAFASIFVKTKKTIKCMSLISVSLLIFILFAAGYFGWTDRYFILPFVFGLIPSCIYFSKMLKKTWFRNLLIVHAVFVSMHSMLFSVEKKCIYLNVLYRPSTIWNKLLDRDLLRFQVWEHYLAFYKEFRARVKGTDMLAFVDAHEDQDPAFLYPFLKGRNPTNTDLFIFQRGHSIASYERYDYVLAYRLKTVPPGMTLVLGASGIKDYNELCLYKKTVPDQ